MATISSAQVGALDKILSSAVDTNQTPALVFAVADAHKTIYSKAVGHSIYNDATSPVIDEDVVQMICSQTKLITSIAGLQLIDSGKLSFETPVSQYFPQLGNLVVVDASSDSGKPVTRPAQAAITIGQLFNHTSGLSNEHLSFARPGSLPDVYTQPYSKEDTPVRFLERAKGEYDAIPVKFEPGTEWAYSYSTDILGFVIEQVSGLSLADYFTKHIFSPLNIAPSFYPPTEHGKPRQAMAFRRSDGTLAEWNNDVDIFPQDPANVRLFFGAGGLYASQMEYLAVLQNLLGTLSGTATTPLISAQSAKTLFDSTVPEPGLANLNAMQRATDVQFGRGLSVTVADRAGRRKKGSGSWGGWANTFFWIDPISGIAGVLGTQLAPPGDLAVVRVYDELERAVYAGLQGQ